MVRKEVADRAAHINTLYKVAYEMLKAGYTEDEIVAELEDIAIRNWAPSYNTRREYIQAALRRAKGQVEAEQKNPLTWTPPKPQTQQPQTQNQAEAKDQGAKP